MPGPFSLRIVNHITNPVLVGFFGADAQADFRVEVPAGGTFDSPPGLTFFGGHRMVVVWDNLPGGGQPIVLSKAINMQGNTGLNITPGGVNPFTPA